MLLFHTDTAQFSKRRDANNDLLRIALCYVDRDNLMIAGFCAFGFFEKDGIVSR
jgi:hypothetical protein